MRAGMDRAVRYRDRLCRHGLDGPRVRRRVTLCHPPGLELRAEGIPHGASTSPEGHHHLRDHGQPDAAGPVALSADHAAADRRQFAGGGRGGGGDRAYSRARSRNRRAVDVDRSVSRRDGPHPRQKRRPGHQSDHRSRRTLRAVRGRSQGGRSGHHPDRAGAPGRACRTAEARYLHARSQHHEFRRAGGDQHADQCAQDGRPHPRRRRDAGTGIVR